MKAVNNAGNRELTSGTNRLFGSGTNRLLDMYSVTDFWGQFVSNYLIFDTPDIGSNTGFSG